jgi:hypothetical protein
VLLVVMHLSLPILTKKYRLKQHMDRQQNFGTKEVFEKENMYGVG